MKTIYHKANTRGHANHGWLNTYHTFSFANYYNPKRMNFGVLRVLNDDTVMGGEGFDTHPHRDMEIVSIPLEGALRHGDSMGNEGVIRKGEIQVMSAGTGVLHSEKNDSPTEAVKFLQIWIFPQELKVKPRYAQITIADNTKPNDFQQILSPYNNDGGLWIHQDAWFFLADFEKGTAKEYRVKKEGNGVYVFVIKGEAKIGNQILGERDGLGISDTDKFTLEASTDSEILLMDIPMAVPE
ncbi:MAG: pirin family protein [Dysgonamonadaceae bacterium]|nr:pirin family protein [Dysgonamonadaceae bacterium]